jgi:hypothetical protein
MLMRESILFVKAWAALATISPAKVKKVLDKKSMRVVQYRTYQALKRFHANALFWRTYFCDVARREEREHMFN